MALELIERGVIEAGKIVTATYPLARAVEAFAAARSPAALKVVIRGE